MYRTRPESYRRPIDDVASHGPTWKIRKSSLPVYLEYPQRVPESSNTVDLLDNDFKLKAFDGLVAQQTSLPKFCPYGRVEPGGLSPQRERRSSRTG
jgi:hypothetical protein